MKASRIENGEWRRADPASVTHPDFLRALERIRRYLGAYPDNIPTRAVPCLNQQGNPG